MVFVTSVVLYAQTETSDIPTFTGHIDNQKSKSDFINHFKSSDLFVFDGLKLDDYVSNINGMSRLKLDIGQKYIWDIALEPIDIRSDNYLVQLSTPEGTIQGEKGKNITYRGFVNGHRNNHVRLAVNEHFIYGYIQTDEGLYFIEPAKTFTKNKATDEYVIYKEEDILENESATCGARHFKKAKKDNRDRLKMAGSCASIDLAIASDYSYYTTHGSSQSGVTNQTSAIMNMVIGDYTSNFDLDIDFNIVENYISTCSNCDPWTSSTNSGTLLNSFSSWGGSGFSNPHDLGQFWSSRNFDGSGGTIGVAWIGAVCVPGYKYHILMHYTSSSGHLRNLVSHEIGHNFGSGHDGSSGYIMSGSVGQTPATQWSSGSVNSVNSFLESNTFNCSSTCIPDCPTPNLQFDITSVNVSNCQVGNPSTYDLTLTVTHGGGDQNGFNVNIAGVNYFTSFSSSPQNIIIPGLVANGSQNVPLTVLAVSNSESACQASTTFDAPINTCSLYSSEDFDDCEVPSGWSVSTTSPYTFVFGGGVYETKWEWQAGGSNRYINSYGASSNANTSKTIDGSCMAYFDDDISNHVLFTGTTTMETSEYDLSSWDEKTLNFDYNFNNGGESACNFRVEIYNGSSWVNILTDNSNECNWNNVWAPSCNTSFSYNLANYSNSDFKVRFIFTDGGNGAWTGMIALDNFVVSGTSANAGSGCDPSVTVTSINSSNISAENSIDTEGNLTVDANTVFNAPNVTLNTGFSIMPGVEFEVQSDGCSN